MNPFAPSQTYRPIPNHWDFASIPRYLGTTKDTEICKTITSPSNDSRTEVESECYSDAGSPPASSPNAEREHGKVGFLAPAVKPETFKLPQPTEDGGYYGVLWHSFYRPDGIRTEARIIEEGFAQMLAQELSRYQRIDAGALARELQSWGELGKLRRTFCLWLEISTTNYEAETYQAVKKCAEETQTYGRMVLENYETNVKADKAGDPTIIKWRTDLFLDLCIGQEVDLLNCGQGITHTYGQLTKSCLQWWTRIDDKFAELTFRGANAAGLTHKRTFTIEIAGDITNKLRAQGIFFRHATLTTCPVAEQLGEEDTRAKRLSDSRIGTYTSKHPNPTSKRHSVDHIGSSASRRRHKQEYRLKGWREEGNPTPGRTHVRHGLFSQTRMRLDFRCYENWFSKL